MTFIEERGRSTPEVGLIKYDHQTRRVFSSYKVAGVPCLWIGESNILRRRQSSPLLSNLCFHSIPEDTPGGSSMRTSRDIICVHTHLQASQVTFGNLRTIQTYSLLPPLCLPTSLSVPRVQRQDARRLRYLLCILAIFEMIGCDPCPQTRLMIKAMQP